MMAGRSARAVALTALRRIDEGAYANLVVPPLLERSGLGQRDRAFVTALVYGTTRMRRACDWLVDRFVLRSLDDEVRAVLRLGAYQLVFLGTSAHAAVAETVTCAPQRARPLVNAVLRRVAAAGTPSVADWPDDATRLSYPDWVVGRLTIDVGGEAARAALEAMNEAATVTRRADGYTQDLASQWVAAFTAGPGGERVADLCAAPGGKATALARAGPALVVAADHSVPRAVLMQSNVRGLGLENVAVVVADGRRPPVRAGRVDRVLVDAPCSGLGALRRRPDARWRVRAEDIDGLVRLQQELLDAATELVRPGGTLVYSVCTLSAAETVGVDAWMAATYPAWEAVAGPGGPWQPHGRGALVLPQTAATDGMFVVGYRRPGTAAGDAT
jgi:16S rRNA (cytosine967-C5)-methyltransferase